MRARDVQSCSAGLRSAACAIPSVLRAASSCAGRLPQNGAARPRTRHSCSFYCESFWQASPAIAAPRTAARSKCGSSLPARSPRCSRRRRPSWRPKTAPTTPRCSREEEIGSTEVRCAPARQQQNAPGVYAAFRPVVRQGSASRSPGRRTTRNRPNRRDSASARRAPTAKCQLSAEAGAGLPVERRGRGRDAGDWATEHRCCNGPIYGSLLGSWRRRIRSERRAIGPSGS